MSNKSKSQQRERVRLKRHRRVRRRISGTPERPRLVVHRSLRNIGAQLVDDPNVSPPVPMLGHVTSSYRSAELGRTFALALLKAGRTRHGEVVRAWHQGAVIDAVIGSPVFVDPEGARKDG